MVQIINLFPSVSVVIEQPIPSIQGGWNRGYFFSLLELCWALALTLPGAMVLGSFGNPVPAIHCKEPFRDNNFEFRCVTWASKDLFMLMKYPEKRYECWLTGTQHSNVHLKLLKIFRCGNPSGDVTRSLGVSVISCGYKFFLGIFQYFYSK